MKPAISYLIIVGLSVGLFLAFFRGCNPEYKDKIVFVDSSGTKELRKELAISNQRHDRNESFKLRQHDSIEILNKLLKTAKNKFYPKYIEILKDSMITDSNCLLTLFWANETINQYDAKLGLVSRSLDSCFKFSSGQTETIKILTDFSAVAGKDKSTLIAELGKFKHWFWRVYWKRK